MRLHDLSEAMPPTPDNSPISPGTHGRAWEIDLPSFRRNHPGVADANIGSWIIEAPWAHPIWHSYVVHIIHLRPMDDGRPTIFHVAGATHELHLYALDPDTPRRPVLEGTDRPAALHPINFAAQMIERSDSEARDRATVAIRQILDGHLNPDTDGRAGWVAMFGDRMLKSRRVLS